MRLDHNFVYAAPAKGGRKNKALMHAETLRELCVGQNYRLQDIQLIMRLQISDGRLQIGNRKIPEGSWKITR